MTHRDSPVWAGQFVYTTLDELSDGLRDEYATSYRELAARRAEPNEMDKFGSALFSPAARGIFVLLIQDLIGCHAEGGYELVGRATLRRLHGPLHLKGRLRSGAPRTHVRPAPWL